MVHESVQWFGEPTDAVQIEVLDACSDHCGNGVRDCGETSVDCGGECPDVCLPVELGPADAWGGYVRVAAASSDKAMVVWHRLAAGNDNHLRWTCSDGQAWSPIQRVTLGTGAQEYPWLVSDDQGAFHLAHNDGGADDESGVWLDPRPISPSTSDAHEPSLDVDEEGNVHLVWSECTPPGCEGEFGSTWYLKSRYEEMPP